MLIAAIFRGACWRDARRCPGSRCPCIDPQRTSDQSGVISLNFDANDSDQQSKSGDRHERESYFEKLSSVEI